MRHATDPDHVIAVTTIVSRERRLGSAALVGALWGIGHTVTIVLAGVVIIVFGAVVSPRVGLTMELSVALMLVLLGAASVLGALRSPPHAHGDYVHAHAHPRGTDGHGHGDDDTPLARLDLRFGWLGLYQVLRPLVVGVVHGLAGSAAVALLVLASIREPLPALGYLVVFGVGTIVGMVLVTVAISVPFAYTARRSLLLHRSLAFTAGLLSLGFGLFLVYHTGFAGGLFTGEYRWTPQ
jgi:high-affinity nickel-transport protein